MSQRVPSPALSTEEATAPVVVDPAARAIGMLAFGAAGMRVVRRWLEQVPEGTPVTWAVAQRADAVSLAELERLVAAAPPGWHLMLAGAEADVRAAHVAVRGLGLRDAVVRLGVTGQEPRLVWCPHCSATTATDVLPGDQMHCSGCTVPLRVPAAPARPPGVQVGLADDREKATHQVA